jgi:hypothetical protein
MSLLFAFVACYRLKKCCVECRFLVSLCFACYFKSSSFTDQILMRSRPEYMEVFAVKERQSITVPKAQHFLILSNTARKVLKLISEALKVALHFYRLKLRRCCFHNIRISELFMKIDEK